MDEPRIVPAISAAEAEAFFTEGEPAWPAKTLKPANLPGRARVAGEVPPSLRAFLDGECGGLGMDPLTDSFDRDRHPAIETFEGGGPLRFELAPIEVVELRSFADRDRKRDELLGRLLFSARNLAQGNISSFGSRPSSMCLECCAVNEGATLAHKSSCLTGQTLVIIAELISNSVRPAAYGAAR